MTLAEEMFDKYHPDGAAAREKDIERALDEIKDAMLEGKNDCTFDITGWDIERWYIKEETLDYLRNKGFDVEESYDDGSYRTATVKWTK